MQRFDLEQTTSYGNRPTYALQRQQDGRVTLFELLPERHADGREERYERVGKDVSSVRLSEAVEGIPKDIADRWNWDGWVALRVATLGGVRLDVSKEIIRDVLNREERNTSFLGGQDDTLFLSENAGVKLAVAFEALMPLRREDKMREIVRQLKSMSDEEAYYWNALVRSPTSPNGGKALRVLLAGHV